MVWAPIDVVVRHVTDLEEVTVNVLENATIGDVKVALAAVLPERPELLEVGELLRVIPDGTFAPIKETMRVANRRLLGFKGCPLHPPPLERPVVSLEDFAEFDPDEDIIGSPRSLRACHLEGVAPEDLNYVPLEDYARKGIEPRIAELWYDFFEAMRQDTLRDCRATRHLLIAEDEGRTPALSSSSSGRQLVKVGNYDAHRISDTGGNWCGALEHSHYKNVQEFFKERNEMCSIDRIYKGAIKPYRPNLPGSRYFSNNMGFRDPDPILAGDNSNDAADKLDDLLRYYKRLPNCKKFVEEQRLNTESGGIVQYDMNTKQLHKDQSEYRRLIKHRMDTEEVQIALVDGEYHQQNDIRADMDRRFLESKPPRTKLERIRNVAIKKRADYFAERREAIHEKQLDYQYMRCDELHRLTLRDQATAERVHQYRSLRKIGFAREWTKRRVQWQINHNSISANRSAWNEATKDKQQNAQDRVDTQRLIRQKWIEYRREITTLKKMYADLAAKREEARQDARREAVAVEFSRIAQEEALPSPSPLRRSISFASNSLASSAGSLQYADMAATAPFSPLLKQPRVVKRIARLDFPRHGSGMLSSTSTSSTRTGNWSCPSTIRQSTSMQSLGNR